MRPVAQDGAHSEAYGCSLDIAESASLTLLGSSLLKNGFGRDDRAKLNLADIPGQESRAILQAMIGFDTKSQPFNECLLVEKLADGNPERRRAFAARAFPMR